MFAITGITGKVGGEVARNLLASKQQVRAVVRDRRKGEAWAQLGCGLAHADINDALTSAFKGVESVFVLNSSKQTRAPSSPASYGGNFQLYVDKKSKIQGTTGNNNCLRPWPLAAQRPGRMLIITGGSSIRCGLPACWIVRRIIFGRYRMKGILPDEYLVGLGAKGGGMPRKISRPRRLATRAELLHGKQEGDSVPSCLPVTRQKFVQAQQSGTT